MTSDTQTDGPRFAWSLLYVTDVAASAALYCEAFGLTVGFAHPGGDYTEFATGPTTLALCARSLASDSTGMALVGGAEPSGNISLVVDDVAAAFAAAVAAGATPVSEPVTKPWGQVSSYVADPDGNLVELASTVPG